jgi:hypothetical protein
MLVLAVEAEQKLRNLPVKTLVYFGLVILALIVVIVVIKRVAGVNRIMLLLVGGAALIVLALTWVYNRSEPKFLSPVVDKIAPFFPSAPTPISQRPNPGDLSGDKKQGKPAKPGAPAAAPAEPTPPPPPAPAKVY